MSDAALALARDMWDALGGDAARAARVAFRGGGSLPSAFAVTDLAAASIGVAALAADEFVALAHPDAARGLADRPAGEPHASAGAATEVRARGLSAGKAARPRHGRAHALRRAGESAAVEVDRRLASFWFASSLRPIGWQVPPLRDPLTGDYRTRDGWIRLHANAPHHRAAVRRVLGAVADHGAAQLAVAGWAGTELEQAIVDAGGCAAEMRDADTWRTHPQGMAVRVEPLVVRDETPSGGVPGWTVSADRPLSGVRVLDMTRVLAGPIATRFLAGLGATVLRIDPPDWDEPGAVPDVTLGKRCARLDLKTSAGCATFDALLARADVFVHGLRPGALDALGFDAATRARIAPGLVDVCLDAYGWHGPWAMRRGFDSLVQMSCGIAAAGMRWRGAHTPVPLPVQALDHATGYLMAAAALRGITRRIEHGVATRARLSLARTAQLLIACAEPFDTAPLAAERDADACAAIEATPWGPARRIETPWRIAGVDIRWDLPAAALGSASARWP